jgi:Flp pilus assembly pilin Flp
MTSTLSQVREVGESGVVIGPSQAASTFPILETKVHKVSRSFRKQRGAAAVEFAVVAPVFVLLIFGMIEYGRMVMVQQMLTNASREGARRAVLEGADETAVRQVVKDYLTPANIPVTNQDITILIGDPAAAAALSSADFGEPIHVKVGINFGQVSWLPSPMYLSSSTRMEAVSVMRKESVN